MMSPQKSIVQTETLSWHSDNNNIKIFFNFRHLLHKLSLLGKCTYHKRVRKGVKAFIKFWGSVI